jgi:D-sedoheptulose 7-phosphate isomerase
MDMEQYLTGTLEESIRTKRHFWETQKGAFMEVAELLLHTVRQGNKVLVFGNGGSACDALHFAGEWTNRYVRDRRPLPCLALTSDATLLTSIGNDYRFEDIFSRQIEAFGQKGDVALGISTSGNSPNVIHGLEVAGRKGLHTIALLGGSGGKILQQKLADHLLVASASNFTARIQETHGWVLHSWCDYVDQKIGLHAPESELTQ